MICAKKGRTVCFGSLSKSFKRGSFLILFALFSLVSSFAQEQVDLTKMESQVKDLSKQVGLHKSILNGLSEEVNGLRRGQKEVVASEAKQQESIEKLNTLTVDLQAQLAGSSQAISSVEQQLNQLIQEQIELRESVESSASKVQTAIVISAVVGVLSVLIAFLVARAAIRNNKLNWYSLVRDTLNSPS